jgi:hypothetical protein
MPIIIDDDASQGLQSQMPRRYRLDLRDDFLVRPALRVFDADFFDDARRAVFFFGTLAPSRRASDSPIAMACLRLFTLRPERPLRSVPRLRSRIARPTFADAFFEYLRAMESLLVARR